ncbi:MAG: thioredoxin [Amnibacterium sp.]|nr:thioredoxin [Amnibacterium sp.]
MLLALLAVLAATGVGIAWRRGDGTTKRGSGERIRPAEVALEDDAFGPRGTLLFFTADHDVRSVAVRDALEQAAAAHPGVRIAAVDLGRRGDLAGRYAVTTLPSVFVLDGDGRLRFRMKGAPRLADVLAALESVAPPP